jgi:hypothetical protein
MAFAREHMQKRLNQALRRGEDVSEKLEAMTILYQQTLRCRIEEENELAMEHRDRYVVTLARCLRLCWLTSSTF